MTKVTVHARCLARRFRRCRELRATHMERMAIGEALDHLHKHLNQCQRVSRPLGDRGMAHHVQTKALYLVENLHGILSIWAREMLPLLDLVLRVYRACNDLTMMDSPQDQGVCSLSALVVSEQKMLNGIVAAPDNPGPDHNDPSVHFGKGATPISRQYNVNVDDADGEVQWQPYEAFPQRESKGKQRRNVDLLSELYSQQPDQ